MSPILDHQDVIIRDSIIENKERIKSYWEQLMMEAAAETNVKMRVWDTPEITNNGSPTTMTPLTCSNSKGNCKDFLENGTLEQLKNRVRSDLSFNSLSMEDRIALELQEQKEREEELKRLRKELFLTENGKELVSSKDLTNGSEELCSFNTNDDGNYSEYGSEEKEHSSGGNNSRANTPHSEEFLHRRTQSLDSVSSGHSSGSGWTLNDKYRDYSKRKVVVRPFEDPQEEEELPAYKRIENETPIEREIRIAKEREEELRKEKGIMQEDSSIEQFKIPKVSKKDAVQNDTRDVQHRIATNRIQQEIEEAHERENELRTQGKILTTSEERVDAKVTRFTQLAEFAISENRHKDPKIKRSSSVSHLLSDSSNQDKPKAVTTTVNTSAPKLNRRYTQAPTQKGIMQRFIATKGRLSLPAMIKGNELDVTDKPIRRSLDRSTSEVTEIGALVRKGYVPAGEKIQKELQEMERREEELRLQRARNPSTLFLHRSQCNLLNLSDEEDENDLSSWASHKEHSKPISRLSHSVSNPNLTDESLEKVNIRLPNKRFSLLQQWESRIQSANK